MRCRSSDVISIAASRYMPTMPHATASGCHEPVNGTSTSVIPKLVYVSSRIAPTCTPTNATASAPRYRCRLRSHAGAGLRPSALVASNSPHTIVARISAQATMPLERATYHGTLSMAQLPPLLVCDVTDCDDVVADDDAVDEPLEVDLVELADAVWVAVAACPSCQASAPPSESIAATLSAVAALRARAARGLRLPRVVRGRGLSVGMTVGSSMTVKLRTGGERVA